jgi:cytidine deaminase
MDVAGRREGFIGLIAPLGVDLNAVVEALTSSLKAVAYDTNELRLTDLIRGYKHLFDLSHKNDVERYDKYIKAGDDICLRTNRRDIFALYGIAALSRLSERDKHHALPQNIIHVFRQLKRTEEIRTLKEVYGRNILMVGCYSPRHRRVEHLVRDMLKTSRGVVRKKLEAQALEIMATDEEERDNPNGQRVLECYPHADYILDCTSSDTLAKSAERLTRVFFGHPFISPTKDEYCSYLANAAAYRSLDLSRQVGAAIVGPDCELISVGCNEVPRAGGGTYWADEGEDARDYTLGYDSNQRVREDMARDALVKLQEDHWLAKSDEALPDTLVSEAFGSKKKPGPLARAMLADVIEYGRMVHAEMNALTDAARFRRSTRMSTLYCTTMPCHMCAKLIVAAGVSRVVYLQPYGKSLVEELFSDSIAVDETESGSRVKFETLKGVTPNGFKRAFHKPDKRKTDDGKAVTWLPTESKPIFLSTFPYYLPLETVAIGDLEQALQSLVEPQQELHLDP